MKKFYIYILISSVLIAAAGCDTLVGKNDLRDLKEKFENGIYLLKNDVAQDEKVLKKGSLIKILIKGKADWVKVYAYSSETDPLKVDHILIMYLFEDDFTKKKFNFDLFNQKLMEIVTLKQDDGKKKDAGKK